MPSPNPKTIDPHEHLAQAWRRFIQKIETVRQKADTLAKQPTTRTPKP